LGFAIGIANLLFGPSSGSVVGTAMWLCYSGILAWLSMRFMKRTWTARDPWSLIMISLLVYALIAPRIMAYGFVLVAPTPFFFRIRQLQSYAAKLLLAFLLSFQGLMHALNQQSDSLIYIYAPFLITFCVWLLVIAPILERRGLAAAQFSPC
jgi:hypothetical protein